MRTLFLRIFATRTRERKRDREGGRERKKEGGRGNKCEEATGDEGTERCGCCGRTEEEMKRGGGRSRMLLRDPQTRIPLPSLARARPERVRDEMTRGEIEEKGRWFIGITMKLRDAGVIDGEVIVTGVAVIALIHETRIALSVISWIGSIAWI